MIITAKLLIAKIATDQHHNSYFCINMKPKAITIKIPLAIRTIVIILKPGTLSIRFPYLKD